MKLQNIQEVEEFRKVVHQCKGRVYLESLEGDIFNLKSAMSEYVALGRLLSEQGDSWPNNFVRLSFSGLCRSCDAARFFAQNPPAAYNLCSRGRLPEGA